MTAAVEEQATLGGGCFWCTEAVFVRLKGVAKVVSGYCGGTLPEPSYEQVCAGNTGHAEVVRLLFDPTLISYRELLTIFFSSHDPTTPNRQGNDRGSSYRSAIFYLDETQRRVALDTVADVDASGLWPGPVVTEVSPAGAFWEAEPEHQDYLERIPQGYTCHFARPEWVLARRGDASSAP